MAYATQTTWARERTNLIAVKQSMGVGRGTMSMSAGHSLEDNFGSSVFISIQAAVRRYQAGGASACWTTSKSWICSCPQISGQGVANQVGPRHRPRCATSRCA